MHSNNSPKFSIEFKNNQFISKSEYKREQMLWLGNISHLHPNQAAESQNIREDVSYQWSNSSQRKSRHWVNSTS